VIAVHDGEQEKRVKEIFKNHDAEDITSSSMSSTPKEFARA